MITVILLSMALLSLASDIYLWHRNIVRWPSPWKYLHWLTMTATALLTVLSLCGASDETVITIWTWLMLLGWMPGWIHALFAMLRVPRIGIAARAMLFAAMLYGICFGWKRPTVREIAVSSLRVPPAFRGYRIVHISDLHIGTYRAAPHVMEKIVELVNDAQPDLIVFTGDIVNMSPEELTPFTGILSRMQAADGIVSILGNHDYCTYGRKRNVTEAAEQQQKIIAMQRAMGWKMLLNENIVLHRGTDSIAVIGVENDGRPPFPARADLVKAMCGLRQETFKILLSHDPSHWRSAVAGHTDIDLTLSGHTHAMQLRIGNISPSRLLYREWGGIYTHGRQHLYVNTGTGSNVPFRLGAWPEITVLTLTEADGQ
ncbi:MAG: metallophosphoesterase [Bacteroidaceae bacterium]|nr:metallophosphoesterase [Bacteroidaceae bacterium]